MNPLIETRTVCALRPAPKAIVCGVGLALASWGMLTGCLSRPALVRQGFMLSGDASGSVEVWPTGEGVVALKPVRVLPLYDSQSLVYRTGEHAYERDPYAEWLVPVEAMFSGCLTEAVRRSGCFDPHASVAGVAQADWGLELQVLELYGDFRDQERPMAVMRLRFLLFDARAKTVGFDREYLQRAALRRRTAPALVSGWDENWKRILGEFWTDIRPVLQASRGGHPPVE